MADGHSGRCKECQKANVRAAKLRNPQQYAAYERARFKTPERKAQVIATQRRHRKKHPDKYKARQAVSYAVRTGKLVKQPCACGETKVQAHHHDYSKPLDVKWVCFKCHREQEHGQRTN